jgi:hypothetical protein
MLGHVFATALQFEIVRVVVGSVMISMMHKLAGLKSAADFFLHDNPMLVSPSCFAFHRQVMILADLQDNIALNVEAASSYWKTWLHLI